MTKAETQDSTPAACFLRLLAEPDADAATLMAAADAVGHAWYGAAGGGGDLRDAFIAIERRLEDRIMAAPPGGPAALVWKLTRLFADIEADEDPWRSGMARSALAEAEALADLAAA